MAEDISNKEVATTIAKQTASLEKAIGSLQKQQLEIEKEHQERPSFTDAAAENPVEALGVLQDRKFAKEAHKDAEVSTEKSEEQAKDKEKADKDQADKKNDETMTSTWKRVQEKSTPTARPNIDIITGFLSYGSKNEIIPIIHKTIIQPPPFGIGFVWLLLLIGISKIFFFSK